MKNLKKVLGITLLFIFFGTTIGFCQLDLIPYRKGDKWGFYNKDKKIVIPIKYDYAKPFSEGLAPVKLNGKWGFIDKEGKEVIPLKYDCAWCFRKGLAYVELNGKYGYIDKEGKEVTPIKHDADENIFLKKGNVKLSLEGTFFPALFKGGGEPMPGQSPVGESPVGVSFECIGDPECRKKIPFYFGSNIDIFYKGNKAITVSYYDYINPTIDWWFVFGQRLKSYGLSFKKYRKWEEDIGYYGVGIRLLDDCGSSKIGVGEKYGIEFFSGSEGANLNVLFAQKNNKIAVDVQGRTYISKYFVVGVGWGFLSSRYGFPPMLVVGIRIH